MEADPVASSRYLCQRCGNCCRWPGFARLAPDEAALIAEHIGTGERTFVEERCELHPDRRSLMLHSRPNGECIYLEGRNVCRIQAVKPIQCAGFPNAWSFDGWRDVCEAIEVTPPA